MFARGYRWQDLYPGLNMPGTDPSGQSYTNAASSPALAQTNISPAHVLIAVAVLLIAIRIVWELSGPSVKAALK